MARNKGQGDLGEDIKDVCVVGEGRVAGEQQNSRSSRAGALAFI